MFRNLKTPINNAFKSVINCLKIRYYRCGGSCGSKLGPRLLTDAYCSDDNPMAGIVLLCGCTRVIDFAEVPLSAPLSDKPDTRKNVNVVFYESSATVEAARWYVDNYLHLGKAILVTDCEPAHTFLNSGEFKADPLKAQRFNPLLSEFIELRKKCDFMFPEPIGRHSTILPDVLHRYGSVFFDGVLKVESDMAKIVGLESFLGSFKDKNRQVQLYLGDEKLYFEGGMNVPITFYPGYVIVLYPGSIEEAEASNCTDPIASGSVIKFFLKTFMLKPYLKDVSKVHLYRANRVLLLRNKEIVKEVLYGAGQGTFFVIDLSKNQPNGLNFDVTQETDQSLEGIQVNDYFSPHDRVMAYSVYVLRDTALGNKLGEKHILLMSLQKVDKVDDK